VRDVKEMIQEVVNLAQRVYKDPAPGGFGRTLRREKAGQEKLKQRILSVSAHKSVLTEKQVVLYEELDLGGRSDLFVDDSFVIEVKNVNSLRPADETQILDYMRALPCLYGVLISFPNDRQPSVVAKMFWKEDADEEDASSKPLYPKGVK